VRILKEGSEVMRRFVRSSAADPVGVVLIGCGYWGRNYVRIFGELSDANVLAVCDGSVERLQGIGSDYPDAFLTSSLDEALAVPGVEAAVVCTPAATHHDIAERCLRAGVHVLLEKPMTTTTEDADSLLELSAATGLTLMVGHTFLFNAGIRKVKEYVDRGDAGRLYYLYAQRTSLGPIRSDVNALWDLAPHDISIFSYLLGAEPEWASAVGSCVLGCDNADVGFITLGYPGGIVGHIHVSWADPNKVREVVLVGSDTRIVFSDTNPLERVRVFHKGIAREPSENKTYGEFRLQLRDGDIVSPVIEASEPLKTQCSSFLHCVRTGERPLTDGYVGRRVVSVMEAIDRSLAGGGHPVDVMPDAVLVDGAAA
jgi:predicted dehydrogenase